MDAEVWAWLRGTRFLGMEGVPSLVAEHLVYAFLPTGIAMLIALPVGLWVGHTHRGGEIAVNIANVGRAVPSFGIITLAYIAFLGVEAAGSEYAPVYLTLVLMAVPPILTNTYVGVREVDPEVLDAARGMGLTGWQLVRRVEIPMAMPVIMAGIRTSAVQVVATATLAAYVGLGGLGRPIFTGLAIGVQFNPQARAIVLTGVVLVAVLAVLTELGLGRLERLVVPRGIQERESALAVGGSGADAAIALPDEPTEPAEPEGAGI